MSALELSHGRALPSLPSTYSRRRLLNAGAGIYADSVLLGHTSFPIAKPLLNERVQGQDSAIAAVHRGRLVYVWGDTGRVDNLLGTFYAPAGVVDFATSSSFDVRRGIDIEYFVDTSPGGFVLPSMPNSTVPEAGSGPTWIHSLLVVDDELYALYDRVNGGFGIEGKGVAKFVDGEGRFHQVHSYGPQPANHRLPHNQAFAFGAHVYFVGREPGSVQRIAIDGDAAAFEARMAPASVVASTALFTPIAAATNATVRDDDGLPVYAWRSASRRPLPADVDAGEMFVEQQTQPFRETTSATSVALRENAVKRYWAQVSSSS